MSHEKQPLVSVVTPVFNCGAYLSECIESVQRQTYRNWEYVIVDNCSTDESLKIAESYATDDARIRVYANSRFLNVVANHNHSLRLISPESIYCKFVFADDWLFPECIEKMVCLAEQDARIGLVGAYAIRGTDVMWQGLPYSARSIPGHAICRLKLKHGLHVFGTGTSTLFRSALIRRRAAFYNESNLHADTEACLDILTTYDYGFVHQVLMYMRERDSLTSFSRRFNTYLPALLYELKIFGPLHLSFEELNVAYAKHLKNYYAFLAKSIFLSRGKEFWLFHATKLRELGHPISPLRLGWALSALIRDAVLSPIRTLSSVRDRRRPRTSTWLSEELQVCLSSPSPQEKFASQILSQCEQLAALNPTERH